MKLTPHQEKAVRRMEQDVCVVAGPGSGKTRVLIERFCWLARDLGVKPERILAITFTDKAAINIKLRLVEQFRDDHDQRQQIERAHVSTIHGFCTRLLRENAVAAGVDVEFGVLEETRAKAILRESADEALDTMFREQPDQIRQLLSALYVSTSPFGRQPDLAESLIKVYEAIRIAGENAASLGTAPQSTGRGLGDVINAVDYLVNQTGEWSTPASRRKRDQLLEWLDLARPVAADGSTIDQLKMLSGYKCDLRGFKDPLKGGLENIKDKQIPAARARLITEHFAPLRKVMLETLTRLDLIYSGRKRALAKLDFSDLEERALELLHKNSSIRRRIQERFDYILMDELQDTNPLQWRIVDSVRSPRNFFAVGDINQSIYGFRHADPEVFRRYRDSLETDGLKIDYLKKNYRSRPEILETAHSLLDGLNGIEPHKLEPAREFPSASGKVVEAIVIHGDTKEEAIGNEARWIARRICEMEAENPGRLSGIAVLTHNRKSLKPIEDALNEFRIPCLIAGGRTLLECREVRDLTMLLAVLVNTRDEISLAGVLRSPLVGVHDESLLRLKGNGSLWKALSTLDSKNTYGIASDDIERLHWFTSLLLRLRSNRDAVSPDRLLAAVIDESDYEGGLDARARGNVEKFLALIRDLYQDDPRPPAELLDVLSHMRQSESEAEASPGEASNAVQLMTMHGAKGLEFPVVFLAALNTGGSSSLDPVCYLSGYGFGVKWRDPVTGNGVGDSIYQAAEAAQKTKMEAEENRLLYVAMTRAEERLILTYSTYAGARGSARSKLLDQRPDLEHSDSDEDKHSLPAPAVPGEDPDVLTDRPILDSQHDSSVSVTQLSDFLVCPRKYFLGGYLGFRSTASVSKHATKIAPEEFGSQVHALLAGTPVENPSPEALRLVETYQTSALARRIKLADRAEREFDFALEVERMVILGKIDLWFEQNGQVVLVDYKTDQFDPNRQSERLEPYFLQLRLYALALRRLTGKLPNEALLYFMRSGKTVPVTLDEVSLNSTKEIVRAFRKAQEQLVYPLNEGENCRRCQFNSGMCPLGKGNQSA